MYVQVAGNPLIITDPFKRNKLRNIALDEYFENSFIFDQSSEIEVAYSID